MADRESEVVLETKDLSRVFTVKRRTMRRSRIDQIRAVDRVNIEVKAGATLGVVGESGSGKTTLAHLIVKLLPPSSGSILLNGDDISTVRGADLKLLRRRVQLVFQDPYDSLNPRMRVGRILEEPLAVHRIQSTQSRSHRVGELLELVGLPDRIRTNYPGELSGGQRQRIGIARALTLNPRLVVCDEPVSALDLSVQAQIINLLESIQEDLGLAYIFISHDLGVVEHIADEVAVMYLGRIVEQAPTEKLFSAPHHPYTEALMSAILPVGARETGSRNRIVLEGEPPSPIQQISGCRFRTRCPIAQAICSEQEPPLAAVAPHHFAACHFATAMPIASARGSGNDMI